MLDKLNRTTIKSKSLKKTLEKKHDLIMVGMMKQPHMKQKMKKA